MTPAGLALLGAFWCVRAGRALSPVAEDGGPADWGRWAGGAGPRGPRSGRWGLVGAGLCAGLAVATRYEALLFVLPIGVWCGALGLRPATRAARRGPLRRRPGGRGRPPGPGHERPAHRQPPPPPLDAGYGSEGTLASLLGKPWYGWFGILLSPGCGLIPHTPLMALGVLGVAWMWEDDPAPATVCGVVTLGAIAYYGSLSTTWCAFATWGAVLRRRRALDGPAPGVPLAASPTPGATPLSPFFGGGLLLWSAGTNLLAVLVDFNRGWQDHWSQGVTYLETSWVPFFSGITAHVRLLRLWLLDGQGGLDLYLLYALGPFGPFVVAALLGLWRGGPGQRLAGRRSQPRGAPAAPVADQQAGRRSARPRSTARWGGRRRPHVRSGIDVDPAEQTRPPPITGTPR